MSPADAPVALRLAAWILARRPRQPGRTRALIRRGAVPDPRSARRPRHLADVRDGGDAALRDANGRFGGGLPDGRLRPGPQRAPRGARRAARAPRALDQAIDHVHRFPDPAPAEQWVAVAPGIELGRRWARLASVGGYVPGGSAPYPSSLLMSVVPARVAGVERVVVATPAAATGPSPRSSSGPPA